ncbi:hypothetical protein OHT57_45315 [Streptomyces sp. NBC_00285]|nr:hypothetical protein [Streptomyces sp. NBC_00285]
MSGHLRLGLGTGGVTVLPPGDALGLLADLGHDGVGLTLDHPHLDLGTPDPATRCQSRQTPTSRSGRFPRPPARKTACVAVGRSGPSTRHLFEAAAAASPRASTTVRSS